MLVEPIGLLRAVDLPPTFLDLLKLLGGSLVSAAPLSIQINYCPLMRDKILADNFFEIGSSGYMFDKKECLENGVVLTEMSLYNHGIYPLSSDVVLSTYFVVDKTRNRNTLRSSIWKLIDGNYISTKVQYLYYN